MPHEAATPGRLRFNPPLFFLFFFIFLFHFRSLSRALQLCSLLTVQRVLAVDAGAALAAAVSAFSAAAFTAAARPCPQPSLQTTVHPGKLSLRSLFPATQSS